MEIMIAVTDGKGVKIKVIGKPVNLLMLLVAISKCMAEKISKEKGVDLEAAEDVVMDCIKNGMKTIREKVS